MFIASLSAKERIHEIACILAGAVMRIEAKTAGEAEDYKKEQIQLLQSRIDWTSDKNRAFMEPFNAKHEGGSYDKGP